MSDDWRSRNTLSGRDAAKAAVTIIGLLFACILVVRVVTKALRPSQPPGPPESPPTMPAAK